MKKTISILTLGITSIIASSNALALGYSDNVGVNFTFDQSLTVSLSSADIVINNLAPGNSSDSNIIDINVISNNLSGYTLTSTVGNGSNYDNTNLTHTSGISDTPSAGSPIFTSLSTSESISSLDDFNDNTWGYSYSDQTATTPTWTNYSGLPLYNTTRATLKESNTPSSENGDTIKFKIAAKASTTQPSGEYRNVINFTVTAEHNPVSFYDAFKEAATQPGSTITTLNGYYKMQDMSPSICESVELYDDDSHIQLIDTRDHEVYYIGKLRDNRCWLLDNLRLGSDDYEIPLTPEDTNIAEEWVLPKGITSGFNSYTEPMINAAYKDNTATSYGTASGKVGVYYNYCATSAGTYCYDESSGNSDAKHDVCPANWRLPTGGSGGEYRTLQLVYDSDADFYRRNLSIPLSGYFLNFTQSILNVGGTFWSNSRYDEGKMYYLHVTSNGLGALSYYDRHTGFSIRCITNNE